jgi:hypothetical protein
VTLISSEEVKDSSQSITDEFETEGEISGISGIEVTRVSSVSLELVDFMIYVSDGSVVMRGWKR